MGTQGQTKSRPGPVHVGLHAPSRKKPTKPGELFLCRPRAAQEGTEPSQSGHVCELVLVKNVQNARDSFICAGKAQCRGLSRSSSGSSRHCRFAEYNCTAAKRAGLPETSRPRPSPPPRSARTPRSHQPAFRQLQRPVARAHPRRWVAEHTHTRTQFTVYSLDK